MSAREARTHITAPDTFELKPVSPFRLDLTVWTLRRRPDNLVDRRHVVGLGTADRVAKLRVVWPNDATRR